MRVAIDARLNAYRRGGIPEYTRQLLAALAPLSRSDTFITLQHREHLKPIVVAPNVKRRAVFTPPHHRFEQLALPAELLALRPDLLHCPDFVVPLRRPCPAVVTIHDLAFLHFPEILDDDARRYYGQVRASVHSAQAVIAVSEATRDDIVSLLGLPAARIDVVHEAAGPEFRPPGPDDERTRVFADRALEAGAFALFVSTLEPRKNLPMLLHALKICRDRRPDVGYTLAVAGARGWRYQTIFDAVREHDLEEAVLFLGGMSSEQLRWLYGHCRLYVNPSRYEGFGLPVLEALACGAPTLASNTSSIPEIAGDAALLLPPDDPAAWADAIEALWHDDARRAALGAAGPPQAARFSWRTAAEQTLAIYRRVAAGPAPAIAPLPFEEDTVDSTNSAALAPQHLEAMTAETIAPITIGADGVEEDAPATSDAVTLFVSNDAAEPELLRSDAVGAIVPELADEVVEQPPESVAPPAPDACPRCGALLRVGTLEGATWRADDEPAVAYAVLAWACTGCGALDVRLGPALSAPEQQPAQTVEELAAAMASEEPVAEPAPKAFPASAPAAPATVEELATIMTSAAPTAEPTPKQPARQRGRQALGERKPADTSAPKPPAKTRRSNRKGG